MATMGDMEQFMWAQRKTEQLLETQGDIEQLLKDSGQLLETEGDTDRHWR